jgi:hypothetical protein
MPTKRREGMEMVASSLLCFAIDVRWYQVVGGAISGREDGLSKRGIWLVVSSAVILVQQEGE